MTEAVEYKKLKEAVEKTLKELTECANLIVCQEGGWLEGYMQGLIAASECLEKNMEG